MKSITRELNVHIVPVGTEIDRAVLPLKNLAAQKVILLNQENPDEVARHFEAEVKKRIKKECPSVEQIEVECWGQWDDLAAIMSKMIEIISRPENKENHISINISSGAKLTAIAGTIVSMMYRARPYYVKAKKYNKRTMNQTTEGLHDIIEPPRYTIDVPNDERVLLLWIISQYERASPKNLITEFMKKSDDLLAKGAIKEPLLRTTSDDGRKLGWNALLSVFRRKYVDPIEEWGYIQRIGRNRGVTYTLTEEGKNVLKIFTKGNKLIQEK